MKNHIYQNTLEHSPIKTIIPYIIEDSGVTKHHFRIERHDSSPDEMSLNRFVTFLNINTGKTGEARTISEEVGTALMHDFSDVMKLRNGEYSLLSPMERKKLLAEKYETAPARIERNTDYSAISCTGETFPLGLRPEKLQLDATLLGLRKSDQKQINRTVVNAARELSCLPHLSYRTQEDSPENTHGTMPEDFFENHGQYTFTSHEGVRPSEALKSVFAEQDHPLITECCIATQLILYKATLDVLGDDRFDALFFETGIRLEGTTTPENPIFSKVAILSDYTNTVVQYPHTMLRHTQPGTFLYIANIAPYTDRHSVGEAQGFNVVYLGKNKNRKSEFGGLFTEKRPHTYNEIIDHLIQKYNETPFGVDETRDQELAEKQTGKESAIIPTHTTHVSRTKKVSKLLHLPRGKTNKSQVSILEKSRNIAEIQPSFP